MTIQRSNPVKRMMHTICPRRQVQAARILLALFLVLAIAPVPVTAQDEELQFGEIAVSSDPTGATIYLNGVQQEKKTNGFILNVYPGIHTIRLTLPGYRDFEQVIGVEAKETTYVYHEFVPAVGTVVVSSVPTGASIYLDGAYYGRTNTALPNIPAGLHTIQLTHEGFADKSASIYVTDGMSTSFHHNFQLVPTTGSLSVITTPEGAVIYLDGIQRGVSNRVIDGIEPGAHELVLTKDGYKDARDTVEITAGVTMVHTRVLEGLDGTIVIDGFPAQADVYIDGELRGMLPFSGSVPQGDHRIEVKEHGFETTVISVSIGFETLTYSVTLTPLATRAIIEAESKIAANAQYDQSRAQAELDDARQYLADGKYVAAYDAAVRAGFIAGDVDSDGIPNFLDLQPTVKNDFIYLVALLALLVMACGVAADWMRTNARPEIEVALAESVDPSDVVVRVDLSVSRPYHGGICTVALGGKIIEYLPDVGSHEVHLGPLPPGVHQVTVEFRIEKLRYGSARKVRMLEFEIGSGEVYENAKDNVIEQ
ncbi:MAG: PEGA domain-containing protein [Methanomicrobiales archaeon]|nr:PEGA domain-containing protein [Methanomicrobiales archaeon]